MRKEHVAELTRRAPVGDLEGTPTLAFSPHQAHIISARGTRVF